ncbi:unnamed protein product, partial [Closterium sp. Naga37s-1]
MQETQILKQHEALPAQLQQVQGSQQQEQQAGDATKGPANGEWAGNDGDLATKVRKPYTITKQRERWTEDEHNKFLEALKLYGRAWRRIEGKPHPSVPSP